MKQSAPPEVSLEQIAVEPLEVVGQWRVAWRVVNLSSGPLEIGSARLPHGQFKSEEIRFAPPLLLDTQTDAIFLAEAHCKEPPGLVTENAFVILYVRYEAESWRLFVRIRVTVDEDGVPATTVESITTQQVGFSGVTS